MVKTLQKEPVELGMQLQGLLPIIVCSNDDPGLTLTYFTARSNLGYHNKKHNLVIGVTTISKTTWSLGLPQLEALLGQQ